MKKMNKILIYLISIVAICLGVVFFNKATIGRSLSSFLVLPSLLIPFFIKKIFKIKISDTFYFVYIIYMFLIEFLGCSFNLYNTTWWYDIFAHFLTGVLASLISLVVLNWFKNYKENNIAFNAFFIICFNIFVSGFWEILEFFVYLTLKIDVQHHLDTGVFDTMEDMLAALLGGIIILVIYLINRNKKNNFFDKLIRIIVK